MGPQLQRSTRVARLDGSVLTVQVSEDAYRTSVERLEEQILGRFQREMGRDAPRRMQVEVTHGFWRPQEGPAQRSKQPSRPWTVAEDKALPEAAAPVSADPAVVPRGSACLAPGERLTEREVDSIQDPEQRARLLEVANRYLARSRDKPRLR